jgi:outer membrane protein
VNRLLKQRRLILPIRAKRNLSSTRYAYIQNVLLLKHAGGTITDEDITAINSGLMAEQ